jgi:energy-converting hydrogenase Eha subunit H
MTIYQLLMETFEEICILLGFFTLLIMLCVVIRMFFVYLRRKHKQAIRQAEKELQQEEAQKSAELRQRDLIAYYDLLSEDATKSSKPNKYIVNLYNFNID